MAFDTLIRGGEVVDPSRSLRGPRDVAIADGRIAEVAETIDGEAVTEVDARGLLVVPGLIDLHVHVYPHSPYGLEPDPVASANGVTTMLDAGTAGSSNFAMFRRGFVDHARPKVLCLVNVSSLGIPCLKGGELIDPRFFDPDGARRVLREHTDIVVGLKIRAESKVIGEGDRARTIFRRAVEAAREAQTKLMVHIGNGTLAMHEILDALAPGDVLTHCYKQSDTTVLDDAGEVLEAASRARERGVVFDVAHGAASFGWDVAETALDRGFEPTTISSDLHTQNVHGPVYDLPTTMAKFRLLGMSLERVVELATVAPARALGLAEAGTLRVGSPADVTLLERHEGRFRFADSHGEERVGTEWLRAALTIKNGTILPGAGNTLGRRFG